MGSATYLTRSNTNYIAGEAISKGMLVILDTSNNYPYVIKSTANADPPFGVATADAASGEEVQLTPWPGRGQIVTMIAQGDITEGDLVMPSDATAGSIETLATTGSMGVGKAVEAASDTQYVRVKMTPGNAIA